MIVCVCKNVNEDKIINELKSGLSAFKVIKKYNCNQCMKCFHMIRDMHHEYENTGTVEYFVGVK